jgi:alpha-beta hydrolase superfamily lysophospholipase
MERRLGRVAAQVEQPPTLKFARPVALLPELFTTIGHLSLLTGYLVNLGWEVFALDLHRDVEPRRDCFAALLEVTAEAIRAIEREVIVVGHGLGGLLALAVAGRSPVAASVALAPMLPGFRSGLLGGWGNRLSATTKGVLQPPSGRRLFEFVADADPFHRDALARTLIPACARAPLEVARGTAGISGAAQVPRLIVAGDSDIFVPHKGLVAFAQEVGAQLATIPGRGHWIIGGRALERTIGEVQRFLIKALGRELLLLYPEDSG